MNPMKRNGGAILLVLTLVLALGAGFVLAVEAITEARRAARSEEFQRLVGGLGFGPAVEMGQCAFSFDPRLGCGCPFDHEPIPGGAHFCPQHGCSILYYPPLRPAALAPTKAEPDARLP
jgi:hypothetical protein